MLVVAPHPDDEAIGCAGTMLRHIHRGDRVCVAIATDGRQSRAAPSAGEMARLRHVEAMRAQRHLGVAHCEWLGLPEGAWHIAELRTRLAGLLEELAPDVVYAPSRVDFHPEHLAVAHALALALDDATGAVARTRIRAFQIQVPLTSVLVNLRCDVSAETDCIRQAIAEYASQAASVVSAERLQRYCRLDEAPANRVECFWDLSLRGYVELHREPAECWPQAFRGLRHFPLSDPLAWLVGSRERRRLAAAVDA